MEKKSSRSINVHNIPASTLSFGSIAFTSFMIGFCPGTSSITAPSWKYLYIDLHEQPPYMKGRNVLLSNRNILLWSFLVLQLLVIYIMHYCVYVTYIMLLPFIIMLLIHCTQMAYVSQTFGCKILLAYDNSIIIMHDIAHRKLYSLHSSC